MKHLLAVTLLLGSAAPAAAGLSCKLSDEDYQQIITLEEPLTPETIAAAPQTTLDNLCKARALLRKVRSGQGDTVTYKDLPKQSYLFLTDAEMAEVGPTISRVLADLMESRRVVRKT